MNLALYNSKNRAKLQKKNELCNFFFANNSFFCSKDKNLANYLALLRPKMS